MTADSHQSDDQRGQVISLWSHVRNMPGAPPKPANDDLPPVEDVGKYARSEGGEDDYRHRMLVNLAAVVVCVLLAIAGIWLANKIAEMRKNQDCVLSGRRNCAGISVERQTW